MPTEADPFDAPVFSDWMIEPSPTGFLGIVGQVAAQAREQTVETRKLVDEEIKPVTDDVKRMRMLGLGIMGLLGFAFTALGITLATVGEGAVQVVRAWPKIS